jgi:uncharacterized protein (DUF952 family)
MVKFQMNDSVYKILTEGEWNSFNETGRFSGSADDLRDGFIHLSRKDQVKDVIKKYFSGKGTVYVVAFSDPGLLRRIKWETSSSNDIYPHLYGSDLHLGEVSSFIESQACLDT